MSQQQVTIFEHRLELKEEFQSLLQNINASGQALLGPIIQPIIHGFFEHITLELLTNSFKVTLPWARHFMKATLGWSYRSTTTTITKLPPN
jgi:hypothetical protein